MSVLNFNKEIFEKNVLVIGVGSIGLRHIKNLLFLGFRNIYAFRRSNSANLIIADREIIVISKWKELLNLDIYATIICSPTSMHLTQALRCLKMGSHLLIEKPLTDKRTGLGRFKKEIAKSRKLIAIAYMLRYHPLLRQVKEIVEKKTYGNLLSFSTKWCEYLPDWHPWENYRQSYAARTDLGGGVALTLSHDIDIVNWLTGSKIAKTKIFKNYRSKLKIDVESGCDILYKYQNGVTGHSHLNYYSKHYERYIELIFDNSTIRVDYVTNSLTIFSNAKKKIIRAKDFDRNQLFINELADFFKKTTEFSLRESVRAVEESEVILNICKKENWKND